ncbi:MAG: hypothetical protein RIF33_23710 [Cyclobacteriaceae bacterium]
MWIFSKIKNFVTGGAAEVKVVFESGETDGSEPLRAFVVATAKDDCKVKKVYFKIRGRETYIKLVHHHTNDGDGNSTSTHNYETHHEAHFESEMVLAEAEEINRGETKKWLAEFDIPDDALATYHGKDVALKWEVFAGLDMPGNDPDSDWVEFVINKKMNYSLKTV